MSAERRIKLRRRSVQQGTWIPLCLATNPVIRESEQVTGILTSAMGVISTEMYEALLLAHVPEDKARAAAAEVAKGQDLASRADLLELGAQLRSEMNKRFAEMDKSLAVLKFAVFSGGSIVLALLIKLVFFP